MTPDTVLNEGRQALQLAMLVAAPLLITALLVGVLIGMLQAATQINEMTLSFIPKLAAIAAVMVIAGPWMLRLMVDFTRELYQNIPSIIG